MDAARTAFSRVDYELVQFVPHIGDDGPIALMRSHDTGELFYLRKEEYEQTIAATNFEQPVPLSKLTPTVTRQSPTNEKIALFRSLFKGREDIYALGYLNRKTGKIGYSPVCTNKRNPRICQLGHGVKCRDCEHRAFLPLDDETLRAHFRGRSERYEDVVGLYILREDATIWVLVADFDEGDWQTATAAYRDAARSFGLNPAVERSRSGAGSHLWLFFAEPINAQTARDLGFSIITTAMRTTDAMNFSSYDRLFPTEVPFNPEDSAT